MLFEATMVIDPEVPLSETTLGSADWSATESMMLPALLLTVMLVDALIVKTPVELLSVTIP